jgi:hypothetical protein
MPGRSKRSEASVIINFRHSGRASSIIVQRQRRWDQTGDSNNGGFLFHRNTKESEDELEIIHSTCAGASGKAGQHHSNRILTKFIRPACAHGSSPLLHNMGPEERHKTVTGPNPGNQAGYIVFRSQGRFLVPNQPSVFPSPSSSASRLSKERYIDEEVWMSGSQVAGYHWTQYRFYRPFRAIRHGRRAALKGMEVPCATRFHHK